MTALLRSCRVLRIWRRAENVSGVDQRWVLSLLYPDLLDWNDWLWEQRRLPPLMLAGMGSDPCVVPAPAGKAAAGSGQAGSDPPELWCKKSWGMGQMQGARFESLDNSPMYDAPDGYSLWNSTSHRMRLYDVGQSSALVAECEALAEIATMLGQSADAARLKQRASELGALINRHMWLPELSVYSNVLLNGSAYPRISPTSFYPMLAGIASDEQAERMVATWLTNASRFCVPKDAAAWPPPSGPPSERVNVTCYWGVPSISADDPQFMVAGGTSGIYWRGRERGLPPTSRPRVCLTSQATVAVGRDVGAAGLPGVPLARKVQAHSGRRRGAARPGRAAPVLAPLRLAHAPPHLRELRQHVARRGRRLHRQPHVLVGRAGHAHGAGGGGALPINEVHSCFSPCAHSMNTPRGPTETL